MPRGYAGRRILVTGGTGFIGRHLVAELLAQGAQVCVLARQPNNQIPPFWRAVEFRQGDLEATASLTHACKGMEVVLHTAGFAHTWADASPQATALHWRVNAEGTRHLLKAAVEAGVTRFVFFSSVKAMGEGGERCIDENWPLPPQTAYGRAKRAAEQWVIAAGQHYGIHVVNLRLALVYGPGIKGNLERMAAAIRRGWFPPLPEVGNKRSLVHVRDVVQAALLAADYPAANQKIYIVSDGHAYSSREIYVLICRALGKPVPSWAVPPRILRALARAGDLMGWLLSRQVGFDSETLEKLLGSACYRSDKIQRELGFRPSLTLSEALPEILQKQSFTGKVPE